MAGSRRVQDGFDGRAATRPAEGLRGWGGEGRGEKERTLARGSDDAGEVKHQSVGLTESRRLAWGTPRRAGRPGQSANLDDRQRQASLAGKRCKRAGKGGVFNLDRVETGAIVLTPN